MSATVARVVPFEETTPRGKGAPDEAVEATDVHEANANVLRGAAIIRRAQQVKSDPELSAACDAAVVLARYTPAPF